MFSQGYTLRHKILTLGIVFVIFCSLVRISTNAQLVLLTIILLITGIPHGSLDFYLEKQRHSVHHKKINRALFFAKYLLSMLLYAVLWFFFPDLSLFVFICIAAYHFGEIDWISKNDTLLNYILLSVYGLIVILFMITIHIKDTAPLICVLLKKRFTIGQIITIGNDLLLCCRISFLFLIASIMIVRKRIDWNLGNIGVFLIQTLLLCGICTLLPFYLSFTFYFGIWHSTLSFDIIRKQLNLTNDVEGWKKLIMKCLPFVIITVIALCFFSFSKYSLFFSTTIVTNLIIGIALLTLPHLQVFSKAVRESSNLEKDG